MKNEVLKIEDFRTWQSKFISLYGLTGTEIIDKGSYWEAFDKYDNYVGRWTGTGMNGFGHLDDPIKTSCGEL